MTAFVKELQDLLREHNVSLEAQLGHLHVTPGATNEIEVATEVSVNLGHKVGKARAIGDEYFIKVG